MRCTADLAAVTQQRTGGETKQCWSSLQPGAISSRSIFSGVLGVDAAYVVAVLRIIGINIVLSGDNAIVIALACRALPPRQRVIGIILGAGAAVVLRIFFTVVVQQLFDLPWLSWSAD